MSDKDFDEYLLKTYADCLMTPEQKKKKFHAELAEAGLL